MEALYFKAYRTMNRQKAQLKCAELWRAVKSNEEEYKKAMNDLERQRKKQAGTLLSFWSKVPQKKPRQDEAGPSDQISEAQDLSEVQDLSEGQGVSEVQDLSEAQNLSGVCTTPSAPTPAQDKVIKEIEALKQQEEALSKLNATRLNAPTNLLAKVRGELKTAQKKLDRLRKESLQHQ